MMEDEWVLKLCVIGSNSDLEYDFGACTADNIDRRENLYSLGVAIHGKRFEIDEQRVKLFMFVLSGQPGFIGRGVRRSYLGGSIGCVVLFDKGDRVSFNKVNDYHKEFVNCVSDSPIALVGLKTKTYTEEIASEAPFHRLTESVDISTEEGQALADKLNVTYYETSLQDKQQIDSILKDLTKRYLVSLID